MKRYLVLLLVLCLALTLQVTVLAAEEEAVFYEFGPIVDALQDPPVYYSQSGGTPYWDSTVNCYGDVLDGIGKFIYEEMEKRFAAHAEGTKKIPLQLIDFSNGSANAWVLEGVVAKDCASSSQRDVWLAEASSAAYDAIRAFVYDHPEYFWIREHYGVGTSRIGNSGFINVYYIEQKGFDDVDALGKELWMTVDYLVDAVDGLSDAQKIAWWDNWLAVNNRYNSAALATNYISTNATPWCVIGSMLDGFQPVCEGYAKALQLLCHQVGIPCVQQSGNANGAHMWAAVKLDGQWYFCDPTWNDPGTDAGSYGYSVRDYLLTRQPSSHGTSYYPSLGLPQIASRDYQQPMANSIGWTAAGNTPVGYEIGNGTMIIALYDEDGRFLTMGTCSSIRWSQYNSIYLAPDFTKEVLAKTDSMVRFNLQDAVNWAPAGTAALVQ